MYTHRTLPPAKPRIGTPRIQDRCGTAFSAAAGAFLEAGTGTIRVFVARCAETAGIAETVVAEFLARERIR